MKKKEVVISHDFMFTHGPCLCWGWGREGGDGGGSLSRKGGVAKRHLLEVQANRCTNLICFLNLINLIS